MVPICKRGELQASVNIHNHGEDTTMALERLHPDLERRIAELEIESNQGTGFTGIDWFWLAALGVVGPALLLMWGWPS